MIRPSQTQVIRAADKAITRHAERDSAPRIV